MPTPYRIYAGFASIIRCRVGRDAGTKGIVRKDDEFINDGGQECRPAAQAVRLDHPAVWSVHQLDFTHAPGLVKPRFEEAVEMEEPFQPLQVGLGREEKMPQSWHTENWGALLTG